MSFRCTRILIAAAVLTTNGAILADDGFFSKFQVHGNAAQGFLFSSGNNYLTTNSNDGSAKWTEAALSVTRPITDNLRAGVQVHSYSLGQLGRQRVTLDWAYLDYKPSRYLGIRAGQVKTPTGLYNDVQDIDAVYPWVLLPQGMYAADFRSFSLSHKGGTLYGQVSPWKKLGTFEYQGFGGIRSQNAVDGLAMGLAAEGIRMGDCNGPMAGADLRWRTPLEGLMFGGSYVYTDISSTNATAGPYPFPLDIVYRVKEGYAQYEKGKLVLSGEWRFTPTWVTTGPIANRYTPTRSWHVMADYRLLSKLSVGSYFEDSLSFSNGNRDRNNPLNYQKNTAVNARFDFDRYFYLKVEGHYLQGEAFGLYPQVNPHGYQKDTKLLAARLGFTI